MCRRGLKRSKTIRRIVCRDLKDCAAISTVCSPYSCRSRRKIDDEALDFAILAPSEKRGAILERAYAILDRACTALASWVFYGTPTTSLFVSKAVLFRQVIWSPAFRADLTSFRVK